MAKQTVHYDATKPTYIVLGERALVWPIDHPDTLLVSNSHEAVTTQVRHITTDSKGEIVQFQTLNSTYKAVFPLAKDALDKVKDEVPITLVDEIETLIEELEAGWLK